MVFYFAVKLENRKRCFGFTVKDYNQKRYFDLKVKQMIRIRCLEFIRKEKNNRCSPA